MRILKCSILLLILVAELSLFVEIKQYTFDDHHGAVLRGKSKMDGRVKVDVSFNKYYPWPYFEDGLNIMNEKINTMINKNVTSTYLSVKDQFKLIAIDKAFAEWMQKYQFCLKSSETGPEICHITTTTTTKKPATKKKSNPPKKGKEKGKGNKKGKEKGNKKGKEKAKKKGKAKGK